MVELKNTVKGESIGEKARERFIKLFDKILKEEGDSFSEYMGIESFILDYEKGVYLISGSSYGCFLKYIPEENKFYGGKWEKDF